LNKATSGKHPLCFQEFKNKDGQDFIKREGLAAVAKTARNDGSIFMNPEELDFDDLLMVAISAFDGVPIEKSKIKKG
jgi:alcohol dehydrogenase